MRDAWPFGRSSILFCFRTVCSLACVITIADQAQAQSPPVVPSQILPDVRLQQLPPSAPPTTAPELSVPQAPTTRMPPDAEFIRFVLNELVIDGATAYSPERLRSFYQDKIGQEVSLGDIYGIANEIERRYHEDGYFLARVIVPAQTVRSGSFRLQVIEGYVNEIQFEGDVGLAQALAEQYLGNVTAERPLRLATLERSLLLVNDIPGITAKGLLRPAKGELGAAQLVVTISRKPFDGFVNLDNYGDKYTGLWELAGSASANSFTPFGEQVTLTGLVSDPFSGFDQNKNEWVTQLATSWRFGPQGVFAEGLVSYGVSHPRFLVSEFDFDSKTLLGSITAGYPFIRSRDLSVYGRLGFDYIDSDTDIFGGQKFSRDRLRILHLSGTADFRDAWRGANTLRAELRQGLPVFDATQSRDEDTTRPGATAQETVLLASVSRLQSVISSFDLAGFPASLNLFGSVAGQYAFARLLSYEQFQLGGTRYGRGYVYGELSGDDGIGVTTEVQLNHKPEIPKFSYFDGYQFFSFFDYGRVWNSNGGPNNDLASTGVGIRTSFVQRLSLELLVAKPLILDTERSNFDKDLQLMFRAFARF